MLIWKYM